MFLLVATNNQITLEHGTIEGKHFCHRLRRVIILGRHGQYLASRLRDEDRVFELRRSLSIFRDNRPVVRPQLIVRGSSINHGLDGEHHSRPYFSLTTVVYCLSRTTEQTSVVRHGRVAVEELADSMATVVVVHEEAVLVTHVTHPIANVSHIDIRLYYASRKPHNGDREQWHYANFRKHTGQA